MRVLQFFLSRVKFSRILTAVAFDNNPTTRERADRNMKYRNVNQFFTKVGGVALLILYRCSLFRMR